MRYTKPPKPKAESKPIKERTRVNSRSRAERRPHRHRNQNRKLNTEDQQHTGRQHRETPQKERKDYIRAGQGYTKRYTPPLTCSDVSESKFFWGCFLCCSSSCVPLLFFGVSCLSVFLPLLVSVLCCGSPCGSASRPCSCLLGCSVCPCSLASLALVSVPGVLLAAALGAVSPPPLCPPCSVLAGGSGRSVLRLFAVALVLSSGSGSSFPFLLWEVTTHEAKRKEVHI